MMKMMIGCCRRMLIREHHLLGREPNRSCITSLLVQQQPSLQQREQRKDYSFWTAKAQKLTTTKAAAAAATTATAKKLCFSSWEGHGTDLLGEALEHHHGIPKIVLRGHGPSGFDVLNLVKNMDPDDEELQATGGIVHMASSILVLPSSCFMWNISSPAELTSDSLSPMILYRPKLEYLFLGSSEPILPSQVEMLRDQVAALGSNMVIEAMDVSNAMGTFNILNGEDRMVGAALILPKRDDEEEKE